MDRRNMDAEEHSMSTEHTETAKAPEVEALQPRIVEALRTVYDPEIPVNIYDLGLIYDLRVEPNGRVAIHMTLTAPGCPVAQTFPGTVEDTVKAVDGVSDAQVELVWDPPWTMDRMSEAARLQLGML
jgi:FeS assembly SUF system protein